MDYKPDTDQDGYEMDDSTAEYQDWQVWINSSLFDGYWTDTRTRVEAANELMARVRAIQPMRNRGV